MLRAQPPVVVVPGITATHLRDEYPVDPEGVWGMVRKSWERIQLHPDDVRWEQKEPARVRADAVFGFPYGDLVEELRHDLSEAADEPVPVYPFAYDWRQPLDAVEADLAAFVEEVVARTALLRHYHAVGYTARRGQVDLVGHSMGGLVIAGYLQRTAGKRVRRVATLGAPFRGSFEAALKVVTGQGELPGESASREREAARLTPSLYHLLPRYRGAVTADAGLGVDLFRAATWQASVVRTLAEQIRMHGLEGADRDADALLPAARELLQRLLTQASEHRTRVGRLGLSAVGLTKDDWLALVGLGEETRVHLHITVGPDGGPWFDLRSADRKNGYPSGSPRRKDEPPARPVDTGDGTVPYDAAVPAFLGPENVVGLTSADFGYWELRDRLLARGVAGRHVSLHSLLPAMNVAQKLVVCHLKGEAGGKGKAHGGVWGRRAPDLAPDAPWRPPLEGLREKR